MKVYCYSILLLLLLNCKVGDRYVQEVYRNRKYLMQLCKDKALLKSRGGNFLVFKTFKDQKVNEYYVEVDSGNYKFQRDKIQYTPDIMALKSVAGSKGHEDGVCGYIESLNKELLSFGINGFRTDFTSLGEPFKFYMESGKTIVYLPDLNKSSGDDDYRKSFKQLGDFWYYTE